MQQVGVQSMHSGGGAKTMAPQVTARFVCYVTLWRRRLSIDFSLRGRRLAQISNLLISQRRNFSLLESDNNDLDDIEYSIERHTPCFDILTFQLFSHSAEKCITFPHHHHPFPALPVPSMPANHPPGIAIVIVWFFSLFFSSRFLFFF